ncbi:MAG: hypothetical protein L0L36_04095, partial [Brevibacterium sp.]|nr:hypothetical protein [Brevibacterium sp.]MDN6666033.1 hypothetical protein [Brevibacterium sp.]
ASDSAPLFGTATRSMVSFGISSSTVHWVFGYINVFGCLRLCVGAEVPSASRPAAIEQSSTDAS